MKKQRLISLAVLSLSVGLGCFWLIYHQLKDQAVVTVHDQPGQGLPQIGGDFTLTDQHGARRSTSEFRGKYLLIYFGYSFCPDICPLGLENMSGALKALGRDLDDVVPIFVTIDPQRDTVESLKIYATNFHTKFMMLTGTSPEIDQVLKSYKVYAAKAKPDGTMADYLMDHSTLIYLMDRQGHFMKSFPHTTPPDELAKAVSVILAGEKKIR
ncbi:MAG: SCO family protein [Alphaproteobacteria bacterium]|jgi:cytochrome oxidase Cu insertion factor (SCO1/SenC/PrrC family)|nr:SCO family protein [Alphaproteobacteria bacterium]